MTRIPLKITFTALFSFALSVSVLAEQPKPVPVMLYPDTDHGTCSIGLQVKDGGASVRSGPGAHFPIIATLGAGHVVSGCDEHDGWDGIIDSQDAHCSVGISVDTKQAYVGPCDSGWIDQIFLTSIYG